MSVYRPSRRHTTYIYDFVYQGVRYVDSTHQTTKTAALLVEAKKRLALREQAGGIAPPIADETPRWADWAEVTLDYLTRHGFVTRPAILARTLDMVLAFWGATPTRPLRAAAVPRPETAPRPYHDLTLGAPITDPSWLEKFETWMVARQISGSTRNSYLSACSDLYTCALQPQYRARTNITSNPFADIRRSVPNKRVIALPPDQILALITVAGRHLAHALCIAALAPKLRVASILALEWAVHFDRDLTTITVTEHKTRRTTGAAQVVPISAQLRGILLALRAAQAADALAHGMPPSRYVIAYYGYGHRRDRPATSVKSLKTGLRRAVKIVGLRWGLKDGVTFHVMRHSIATILANPKLVGPLTERLRADVMGHEEMRTTQQYTHLNPSVQEGPHESLSAALSVRAALDEGAQKSVVKSVGTPLQKQPQTPMNRSTPRRPAAGPKRAKVAQFLRKNA